jgi:hypothetical protein
VETQRYYIYCLSGPNQTDIFYVGYTKLSLIQRLKNHINSRDGNNPARANKFEKYGDLMEIHELDVLECTRKEALIKEVEWMALLVSNGHKIVNVSGLRGHISPNRVGKITIEQLSGTTAHTQVTTTENKSL